MPTLYAARGGNTNSNLYTLDPVTAAPTVVGPIGFAATGLAFDPTSGTLYGVTSAQSPTHPRSLITVNPATGAGTFVGSLGTSSPMGDIAFDTAGNLYGQYAGAQRLYSINKATGTATLVGSASGTSLLGNAFEIDGSGNGYDFPNATALGAKFYKENLATGALTQIGTFPGVPLSVGPLGACSFGPAGDLWAISTSSSDPSELITIAIDGTPTIIGNTGLVNFDALVWQGGVKPSPWYLYPNLVELFDAVPVSDGNTCSAPLGALITTDGASQGPSSLKLNPALTDSWISWPAPVTPADTQTIYTSFGLYVDWALIWDSGAAWDPYVLSLNLFFDGHPEGDYYLDATSPTTGTITSALTGATSDAIPNQAWTAVEVSLLADNGAGGTDEQFWVNNVSSGGLQTDAGTHAAFTGIGLGTTSFGGPPPSDLTCYVDDFTWSLNGRIGPVNLAGAFFNGIDSGTDYDACTGTPVSARPVDDFYTAFENITLNVAAPGVMSNDIFPTTVSLNTGPAHGSLILNSDGSFSYTPDPGFLGVDTWVYNGNGGTATVTITVAARDPRGVFSSEPAFKAFA